MEISSQEQPPVKREIKLHHVMLSNLIAGGLARCTSASIMYPVDVVKTRLQFERASHHNQQVSSALQIARTVFQEGGLRAFYRGLSVRLLYVAPAAAVSFTFYEQFKRAFSEYKRKRTDPKERPSHSNNNNTTATTWNDLYENYHWLFVTVATLAAGAGSRVLGTACRTPFDILKQRMQLGSMEGGDGSGGKVKRDKGVTRTFLDIIKDKHGGGFKGLWAGYGVTLLRDVPFSAIYFTTYETCKYWQKVLLQKKDLGPQQHLVAGATAGALATVCTIWADVVKTRLQTQGALPVEERKYRGVAHALKTIWTEEGIHGLTRGLGPRLLYIIPASSVTFTCYEIYKRLLLERSQHEKF